ncbi:Stk1 family PASTA domain-containing Ser/Thr kinase [Lactobacillus jensenii]|uniref:Stk1 family PASTA domain-containing Ser/Thr kinase n=1 Tax=Lactobacillus jensenii TaxID=109790 RepID=UPI0029C32394|nr:Stk1 family PASTA domain-containing Ser/Thr kinase [Lactobacillus jensenii]MDX5074901.1 Stk1 family PASTA domain-containing Ser/Thr kinase [Lactobacillus jensenii]MDX5093630.1 Stk1 family PASTA domain-containing Ser/Thr kinase [Lactobacillus jensenii]MDX5110826.1 Stk1 family PASTA domain-containing Ser/Thr kinase [Lactobacillus jensenii]
MITQGYLLGERYKILDTLGEGGMANVYLAEDIILQRKVAVKVLRLDLQRDPQTLKRFTREAMSTSELSHPNIVSVLDVDTDQGLPYMVMEYIKGPDLHQYLHDNYPLPFTEIIRIMDQILSAVALAHKHNIIHRDLKPENILIDKDTGKIKIADFGIAVALNQSTITQTNSTMGSVHYMSPEQTKGGLVTKQSDIYSLGIILYELLAGKVPFGGETAISIALKHLKEPLPDLKKVVPNLPQSLENVVLCATAKDPRDRYESVLAMKADLDTALNPERANEPVFKPSHNPALEETRVIPTVIPNEDAALKNIKEEKKQESKPAKKKFWKTFKEHKIWLISSIFAILVVLFCLILALSKTNQTTVPDVSNFNEEQAKQALQAAGLKVGEIEYQHSDTVAKDKIIKTLPDKGLSIEKGKSVDLVVSKGAGLTTVPDLVGVAYTQAKKRLEKLGFKVEKQTDYSFEISRNYVMSQSVEAGERVNAAKTTIILVVSKGKYKKNKPKQFKVKDLTGYSLKKVQDYAEDNGLTLKIDEHYSDSVEKGLIISQNPTVGTTMNRGDTLEVVVSKGKQESSSASSNSSSSGSSSDSSSVNKSVSINYDSSKTNNGNGNHIQIYIADDNHQISNIYRDFYITHDTTLNIPFSVKNSSGTLIVVNDGTTVTNERVTK